MAFENKVTKEKRNRHEIAHLRSEWTVVTENNKRLLRLFWTRIPSVAESHSSPTAGLRQQLITLMQKLAVFQRISGGNDRLEAKAAHL